MEPSVSLNTRSAALVEVEDWACWYYRILAVGLRNILMGHTEDARQLSATHTMELSVVCFSSVCPVRMFCNPTSGLVD